jgi:hypothetical protein
MESPPQAGETWICIHTSETAVIQSIYEHLGHKFVLYNTKELKGQKKFLSSFQANWKRHKSASKWFLGALS